MDFEIREVVIDDPQQLIQQLKELFSGQPLAVLSTHENGQPFCSLVAFTATDDLKHLVFATMRHTRKFTNMEDDPRVSMLIDDRSNQVSDFYDAKAVSVTGSVEEVMGQEKDAFLRLYLTKHPHLEDFIMSSTCALMKVQVNRYFVVSRFQHVMVLNMNE